MHNMKVNRVRVVYMDDEGNPKKAGGETDPDVILRELPFKVGVACSACAPSWLWADVLLYSGTHRLAQTCHQCTNIMQTGRCSCDACSWLAVTSCLPCARLEWSPAACISLQPGELYNAEDGRKALRDIFALGLFDNVQVCQPVCWHAMHFNSP